MSCVAIDVLTIAAGGYTRNAVALLTTSTGVRNTVVKSAVHFACMVVINIVVKNVVGFHFASIIAGNNTVRSAVVWGTLCANTANVKAGARSVAAPRTVNTTSSRIGLFTQRSCRFRF